MKKYILLFFAFLVLFLVLSIILVFALNILKPTDYYIDLIIVAMSSIIIGFIFVKNNGRVPTQKETIAYTSSIIIIFIILSIAFTIYRLKPFVNSGEFVITASFINSNIGHFVGSVIWYILATHLPFYLTCRLLAKRYK
jgi:hypothetical protein